MIRFVYGSSGSGKTTLLTEWIRADLEIGKKVLLLVPEQASVAAEISMTRALAGVPTVSLEILNFTRLPNAVFRCFGGLAYHYIDRGSRRLLMSMTLLSLQKQMRYFSIKDPFEKTAIDSLLQAMDECTRHTLTPEKLEKVEKCLKDSDESPLLQNKLHDLSLLRACYSALLADAYDDPGDDMQRMNRVLQTNSFFANTAVYLDGFYSMTPQQYQTMRHIFNQSDSVSVTFACPFLQEEADLIRTGLYKHARLLTRLASPEEPQIFSLPEIDRSSMGALGYLAKQLWSYAPPALPIPPADESVRLFCCENRLAEAEAIARDIHAHLRAGYRCREIAVLTRGIEQFSGILDAALEKYEIPFFYAKHTPLDTKPFIRYIKGLFYLHRFGLNGSDVIELLKTGFSDFTPQQICIFENYVYVWQLMGDDFVNGTPWQMHPSGYTDHFTEQDTQTLALVNTMRRSFAESFSVFAQAMEQAQTIREYATALYAYLKQNHLPEKLAQRACSFSEAAEYAKAQEERQTYAAFCSALDAVVSICGDLQADCDMFAKLLDLVLSDFELGRTPACVDEVTVGDAQLVRVQQCRLIYLFGTNEGVFPQACTENGTFTDAEKEILQTLGMTHFDDLQQQNANEMLYFCDSVASAREKLVISYAEKDLAGQTLQCSMAVQRVRILLPWLVPTDPTVVADPISLVEGERASFELAALYRDTPLGDALLRYYRTKGEFSAWLHAGTVPITVRYMQISPLLRHQLYGTDLAFTQARLNTFSKCAFSYYCEYVLRLRGVEKASFSTLDIGNYMHAVLERFLKAYVSTQPEEKIDHAWIREKISAYTDDYFLSLCFTRVSEFKNSRLAYLVNRLKDTSVLLAENMVGEFSQMQFVPRDFELSIGEDGVSPLAIPLPDGTCARIYGKIDRVDTLQAGENVYVRVIDYKTGNQELKPEYWKYGLDLQLLLYLFSLWENGASRYGGSIQPAGVLYLSAATPNLSISGTESSKEKEALLMHAVERKGIVCDDLSVLRAMEPSLQGKYIPVSCKSDGTLRASHSVADIAYFTQLREQVSDVVRQICMELKDGKADALPIHVRHKEIDQTPCTYCKYRPLCRTYQ